MTRARYDPHRHCWLLYCHRCQRWVLTVYHEGEQQRCAKCLPVVDAKARRAA